MSIFIDDDVLKKLIYEDIHFIDLTTQVLEISDLDGVARVFFREPGVVACSEEAARIYKILGADVRYIVKSGVEVEAGQKILEAFGKASSLHLAWRVAQTLLSYASGVATYTRRMIEKARKVNPRIIIGTTRQPPPGTRIFYLKAVLVGGGVVHRQSLSDTILIFDNHLNFIEKPRVRNAVERALKRSGGRCVGVEVRSLEEAVEAVDSGACYIQFERVSPKDLEKIVREIRKISDKIIVGVGGGITLENIEEYAATGVDMIVTSAPYRAKPIDVTTIIEKV